MKNFDPRKKNAIRGAPATAKSQTVKFANNASSTAPPATNASESYIDDDEPDELEAQVMGQLKDYEKRKSKIMERNLDQMVEVLHIRLNALGDAAKVRLDLCKEDVKANSKKMSDQAPKLMDDFEDGNQRMFKDKIGTGMKDNLVSAEGVYIDPTRLAIRTRGVTETGRKLEAKLEESFGIPNLRELKGKKNKTSNRAARSKKSEARKFELKKQKRQGLEKVLQSNMESLVLRSVLDEDMQFRLPDNYVALPIPVKWSSHDPRSAYNDSSMEGGMDPELLLQYGLERITLPSGEALFRKLIRQPIVHSYLVHLFWFIKVRFFQRENNDEAEEYLLGKLGAEYVTIVELLSRLLPAEHEKDFVFKYFPYIIANSLFYGFYFLCPGARHLYTKSFRKNVLLQVVQVIFGYRLCPISLKVNWMKLFPEEAQEEDEGDDGDLFQINVGSTVPGMIAKCDTLVSKPGSPATVKAPGSRQSNLDALGMPVSPHSLDHMISKQGSVGLLETDGDTPQQLALGGGTDKSRKLLLSKSASNTSTVEMVVNPLTRTALKPPITRTNRVVLFPRQRKEKLDANDISPLMQEFLGTSSSSGGKRQELFRRTVPVSWCVSGGSDTHRKKTIPKELHDELSQKAREMNKVLKASNSLAQREDLKAIRQINNNCMKVLAGGPATVGKLSLDLVKHRKNLRAGLEKDNKIAGQVSYTTDQVIEDENDDIDHLLGL
mmetsp:Transcript_41018/g.41894  ORF Transcript_41018/g.41894 Transcript_41018/m.41894 type:complete len:719 (+) Transcript_41018:210-2366(+)|eukprot:CAMPEP_0182431448 /NCGR_PEP_ID=MMETSP1167-20130531/49324_1 /TAXON_ID=2988 /ORGANISM="Mallomonas Sp, Strain CCMP3275" /LENGTH=718 /DNA_ID=CAMNT_0024617817 /DNA_START=109 /DNA_END=2265 /DNA_ORIENTATION=+